MTSATTNYARDISHALSSNKHLLRWVEKMAELTKPDNIHWVDGSEEENEKLCAQIHAARTASDITVLDVGGTVTAFQSTLPARAATSCAWFTGSVSVFQSTLPARAATAR